MTTEFSHLAIAVQDIDRVKSLFELISGNSITEKKSIQNQKINDAFLDKGHTKIEFIEPLDDSSPISKFLQHKSAGLHHLCISVSNFQQLIDQLTSLGIRKLGDPFVGAKGKRVIFFHPKDTHNILIELEELEEIE